MRYRNFTPRSCIKAVIGDDGVVAFQGVVLGHMTAKGRIESNNGCAVDRQRAGKIIGKAIPPGVLELKVSNRHNRFIVDRVIGF